MTGLTSYYATEIASVPLGEWHPIGTCRDCLPSDLPDFDGQVCAHFAPDDAA